MTILVTGATGLVGARLLPRLVNAGLSCRALLRAEHHAPAGVTAVHGDLLDPASLTAAVTGVSTVIHLAATFRTADTDLIWRVNLEGTRHLIAAVQGHAPDARFILASTGTVYNADIPRPAREDDAADPQQAYPASKLAAEKAVQASGLNWSIQRFGFVYGDHDGHLEALPDLVGRFGWHPAQRMSLVHHQDIATAMHLALGGAMDGQVVNIVDGVPVSMYELVALGGGQMQPSAAPLENPWQSQMDNALARRLGFEPTVPTVFHALRDGLM